METRVSAAEIRFWPARADGHGRHPGNAGSDESAATIAAVKYLLLSATQSNGPGRVRRMPASSDPSG